MLVVPHRDVTQALPWPVRGRGDEHGHLGFRGIHAGCLLGRLSPFNILDDPMCWQPPTQAPRPGSASLPWYNISKQGNSSSGRSFSWLPPVLPAVPAEEGEGPFASLPPAWPSLSLWAGREPEHHHLQQAALLADTINVLCSHGFDAVFMNLELSVAV